MIRTFTEHDIDIVMEIWLQTNKKAHNFIPEQYWTDHFDMVRTMLPLAKVYVYVDDKTDQIEGFIGLTDNYIAGIFVREAARSKGIGKQLLDDAKNRKAKLCLCVYQKNERAIRFYLRENFRIQAEQTDDDTGEKEYVMVWDK